MYACMYVFVNVLMHMNVFPQAGTVWGPLLRKRKSHALGQIRVTRLSPGSPTVSDHERQGPGWVGITRCGSVVPWSPVMSDRVTR